MALALSILWILAAFVTLWGFSLVWRGLWPRGKDGDHRSCPSCGKAVEGLVCGACRYEAESLREFRRPRNWRLILCGWIPVVAGVAAGFGAEAVRGWASDGYDYDEEWSLGPVQAAAVGVAVFAVVLGIWAWRGDRSRGRRRCPKCWYDMSGSKLVCPECGHDAKVVKRLYRARRRKRGLIGAAALLLAAYGVWVGPRVREGGPIAAVPTWVLIVGLPWWPDSMIFDDSGGYQEIWTLRGRVGGSHVWKVDQTLLKWRARGLILRATSMKDMERAFPFLYEDDDIDLASHAHHFVVRALLSEDAAVRDEAASAWVPLPLDEPAKAAIRPYIRGLIAAMDDPNENVRLAAAGYLCHMGAEAAPAFSKIIEAVGISAATALSYMVPLWIMSESSEEGRAAVMAGSRHENPNVRLCCVHAIGGSTSSDQGGTERLLEMLSDPDSRVAQFAARVVCRHGVKGEVVIPAVLAWWMQNRGNGAAFPVELYVYEDKLDPYMDTIALGVEDGSSDRELLRFVQWSMSSEVRPNMTALVPALTRIAESGSPLAGVADSILTQLKK